MINLKKSRGNLFLQILVEQQKHVILKVLLGTTIARQLLKYVYTEYFKLQRKYKATPEEKLIQTLHCHFGECLYGYWITESYV